MESSTIASLLRISQPAQPLKYPTDPFNNKFGDADVILRSADGVNFYAHKNILRLMSDFFADMFSLPQPASSNTPSANDVADGTPGAILPVVPVSEDTETLDGILRMCYPVRDPPLPDVRSLSSLLEGAKKYQMYEVLRVLKEQLKAFCNDHPLDVFAEACKRDILDIAQYAAECFAGRWLPITKGRKSYRIGKAIDDFTPHMNAVSAAMYYHLLKHHATHDGSAFDIKAVYRESAY